MQSYGQPLAREKLPSVIMQIASELKTAVKQQVTGSMVGLAVDGWTDWRHRKTINFVVLWKQTAIFWSSVPSIFGKSAPVLSNSPAALLAKWRRSWMSALSRWSPTTRTVTKRSKKEVKVFKDWLLCLGCTAHDFQHIVGDLHACALWSTPFADKPEDRVNVEVYWQSKLCVAPELAEVGLFFSWQPRCQRPLLSAPSRARLFLPSP